jgi:putative transferase (TIGR04331 family)
MFLVTTAIDYTRDVNKEIIFLGDWCIRDSTNDIIKKYNYSIISYHWNDRTKYNNDYKSLDDLYERYLQDISLCLNKIHNTNNSLVYWRIIIGPWLKFFIDAIFDRYEVVEKAISNHNITETVVYDYSVEDFVPNDFIDFYTTFTKDEWNHVVFAELLKQSSIKFILSDHKIINEDSKKLSIMSLFYRKINNFLFYVSYFLNNSNFLSIYLSFFQKFKTDIKLGYFPHFNFYRFGNQKKSKINHDLRKLIKFEKTDNKFQLFLNKLIPLFFPKIYMEDFKSIKKTITKKFNKNPKIIFTSNAYHGDDAFKIWCAEKKEKGSRIIIGQHGGITGLSLNNQSEDHQLKIADVYCSWGWSRKGFHNICKMPSLQLSQISIKPKQNGKILLVLPSYPKYFYQNFNVPISGQSKYFLYDQIKFVQRLNENLRENIFIRTQGNDVDELSIISKAKLDKFLVQNKIKLSKQLSKYKLCLITYNSTTMLETLSSNFPSLIVLDPKYFEIREEAKDILNKLQEVGILHYSYDSAISFIVKVEKDISKWWLDYKLRSAVKNFCNSYAYTSSNFEIEWKKKIKSWTNEIKI